MITINTNEEIQKIARSGEILAACHRELAKRIKPGVTTWEIDQWVEDYLAQNEAIPAQKDFMGYPYATCASVNDTVCHGFPQKTPLKDGDIVTIDMVVDYKGWLADSAWSYAVGSISKANTHLLKITEAALYKGIEQAIPGNQIGDISHAVQSHAEAHHLSVVRPFLGHGIGRKLHEPPEVPHYGKAGTGPLLKAGMVITIEPILTLGSHHVHILEDGWTAKTIDGSWSAQYEHTIAITEHKPLILTKQ
ncbi:type I methionyl aminopeptidase [Hazenella sp. IB182357]|uniref:Methionine aminopeptidase n=1 Tax=Polycladospora coralii TaxID=2771432 RepID=A0A926RSS2_9BACL|nr:type I methionyl aminopeptidase [Polycladospora coralii]MBD1371805.1 type I methionyl aminopeptidase [Polycladospora coralii]